jgi:hypothetical protein
LKSLATLTALLLLSTAAAAQEPVPPTPAEPRQSLSDAWWTGPILANSPNTLPQGHWLVEPYLYDVITAHAHSAGTSSYILYGLVNRFSIGINPTAGIGSGPQLGDLTAIAEFRLTQFHEGSWVPTTALVAREVLPTGKYDNLGNRPDNGLGSGAYTTQLGLYSQRFFWMPNGRILRVRFDITQSLYSTPVPITGVSVYGTGQDFHGQANPGPSTSFDLAAEYSITRRWVLATDATYALNFNTPITSYNLRLKSGSSTPLGFAPALEYNWSPQYGVIFGTRIIPAMRNTTPSVTPVVAVNMVL